MSPEEASAFIRANTALAAPPLVPEITLHLASELTPIWQATEDSLAARNLPPPFWAFAWAGGQALARHVLDHPAIVAGRRVLDVGAGSGLVAIAAARAGAEAACAAEIDPVAAAAIALNAAGNGVRVAVETRDLIGSDGQWDTVLVGDLCYERPLAERLTAWLRRLAAGGAAVLLGDPGRAYLPRSGLEEIARYTVPTSRELEDRDSREAVVWRMGP
ncbi:MAG TPA: 50S ribosomal protein L11 methyltransferase [Stellaceae bacterium]|nr:50S ribosomal protein L11 methyltransferase [Stellaceae bacterium]